jgi:formate hydrogenlyase subunit 4
MIHSFRFLDPLLGLFLAPLLLGIINRVKSWFGGRQGPPVRQVYFDIAKLLQKGAVYSETTSWLFRAGPIVTLASMITALFLVPFGNLQAPLAFSGDLILLASLLALARFFTVLAGLDTGSAFEGMGASREVQFSALAEPALVLGLAAAARITGGTLSLSGIHHGVTFSLWFHSGLVLSLVTAALVVVYLCENSRIPVDDPNTHLELTMIHEVMVLDHSGPDLAFITYAAALKMWLLGALLLSLVLPAHTHDLIPVGFISTLVDTSIALAGMFVLAVLTGVVESTMARVKMNRVPQLLIGASAISALALALAVQPLDGITHAEGVNLPSPSGRGVGGEGRPMSWAVTRKD